MSEVTNSAANSPTLAEQEELRVEVAKVFSIFQRKYGPRWRDRFEDPKARAVWLASFRVAGLTADSIRHGLAQLSVPGRRTVTQVGWPPSDEEFIALCLPPAPLLDQAVFEVMAWARNEKHVFTHPAIGAAAKSVGTWILRSGERDAVRKAIDVAYQTALARLARGETLDQPVLKALPAHVHRSIPRGGEPREVRDTIDSIARSLGLSL